MECQHCGMCCGEDKRININLTVGDIWRICSHLKISVDEFFKEYAGLKKFGDSRTPGIFDVDMGLDIPCKFRKNERCSIYAARPLNCRIFPYWVLVLVPEERLKEVLKNNKCEYDLSKKEAYGKYQSAIAKILLEESKWFELDKKAKKDEKIKDKAPAGEIKETIAKKLFKIGVNSRELEKIEKILE
jgi:Fe-S-cluster containining protein